MGELSEGEHFLAFSFPPSLQADLGRIEWDVSGGGRLLFSRSGREREKGGGEKKVPATTSTLRRQLLSLHHTMLEDSNTF